MKIKSIFLYLIFILFFVFSCSPFLIKSSNKQLIGRVLMEGTQNPLEANIDIYQIEKKIISMKSDKNGFFKFPFSNKYRNGLTFIIYKNRSDDTSKLTIYGKTLTICKNDTFNLTRENFKDTIILKLRKCGWLTIEY